MTVSGATARGRPGMVPGAVGPLLPTAVVVLACALYAWLVLLMEGDARSLWIAVIPLLTIVPMASPRHALYLLIGSTLVSDVRMTPWLEPFHGIGHLLGRPDSWLDLSPLELMLLFALLVGRILQTYREGAPSLRLGTFFWPMAPFLLFIVFGFLMGMLRGGDLYVALWELRSIAYLPAVYLLFCNTIRTRQELQTVAWIALLGIAVEAFLVVWTYLVILGGSLGKLEAITNHQAAIFFGLFLLVAGAYAFYRPGRWHMFALAAPLPIVLAALIADNRRSAYFALLLGGAVLLALLRQDHGRAVTRLAVLAALLSILYAAAFWNSSSFLAKPIQGIKSLNAEPGTRNYSSNLYRVHENWDISATIHSNPLLGVGFGRKFDQPIPLPYIPSTFREYWTHNSVLWIWLKAGAPGFVAMLVFLGLSIARATNLYRRVEDRRLKPLVAGGLLFLLMYMVYGYVDQAWEYKEMVYMGAVLGSFAVAERLTLRPREDDRREEP